MIIQTRLDKNTLISKAKSLLNKIILMFGNVLSVVSSIL